MKTQMRSNPHKLLSYAITYHYGYNWEKAPVIIKSITT